MQPPGGEVDISPAQLHELPDARARERHRREERTVLTRRIEDRSQLLELEPRPQRLLRLESPPPPARGVRREQLPAAASAVVRSRDWKHLEQVRRHA